MLKFFSPVNLLEAGCDEAGRGCLAGPVFAAAVILPCDFEHSLLNDSKQMKEADRYLLRPIIEKESLAWAVGSADHLEIDSINILNASITAMHRAIANLKLKPELLLVDGNRFRPFSNIDFRCIVKGDSMYQSIAAASVLAKTYRDDFMNMLHQQYPQYGWNKNKAYATSFHRNAIKTYGESPFHRKSFRLKNRQTSLNLEF